MGAIWLVVGLVVGGAVTYAVARMQVRAAEARADQARSERDEAAADARQARQDLSDARESAARDLGAAQGDAATVLSGVQQELAVARTALASTQVELKNEREAHAERMRELREAQERLDERVKAALTDALGGSTKQLVALAKAQLGEERAQAKRELDGTDKKIGELFRSVSGTLEKVSGKLEEVEKERIAAREQLDAQLAVLRLSHGELLAGTQALVGALRRPHVRGRWGEVQLRNVVRSVGMLPHVDFDEQPTVAGDEGQLRPDACVHMPVGRNVVIDAKVPLEAYMEALSATDPDEQQRLLGEHARQLRAHVAQLDSKGYWERLANTPEFVVMFVPNDEVVLAATEADRDLAEYVQRHRVVIATPMNLLALLRIIAMGWRHENLAENAREVEQLGRQLHKRLGTFAGKLQTVGKRVGSLVKAYNEAVGSFDKSVLPGARRFAELGAATDGVQIEGADQVTSLPRQITAGETDFAEGGSKEVDWTDGLIAGSSEDEPIDLDATGRGLLAAGQDVPEDAATAGEDAAAGLEDAA